MAVLLAPPTLRAEGEQSLAKTSQNPVGYETTDGREMKCVW
jgi:hypothetical protein